MRRMRKKIGAPAIGRLGQTRLTVAPLSPGSPEPTAGPLNNAFVLKTTLARLPFLSPEDGSAVVRLFELRKRQLDFANYPAGLDLSEAAKERELVQRQSDADAHREELDRQLRAASQGGHSHDRSRRLSEPVKRRKVRPPFGGQFNRTVALTASKELAETLFTALMKCYQRSQAGSDHRAEDIQAASLSIRSVVIAAVHSLWIGYHSQVDEWYRSTCEPEIMEALSRSCENLISEAVQSEIGRISKTIVSNVHEKADSPNFLRSDGPPDLTSDAIVTLANPSIGRPVQPPIDHARVAKEARALTVAKLIGELDALKPQMFEDQSEYNKLRDQYPDFLTFAIAETRPDLKTKVLSIRCSTRHIRLAQELAAARHGLALATIQDDWKDCKPAEFKRPQ